MKKKYIIIIIFLIILIVLGGVCFLLYNREVKITLNDNLTANIFDKKTNLSFIKDVTNGKIITKESLINTSKLGIKEISITLKNSFGKETIYKFNITIVDTEAPVITHPEKIEITIGDTFDLLKDVKVTDNSNEDIKVEIEGEYSTTKAGEYQIYYVAKDSSNNETKEKVMLIVKKKSVSNNNLPTKIMDDTTFTTSKGYQAVIKKGILYIDGILIANKSYYLPSNYGNGLTSETIKAFNIMKKAASEEGLNIYISSGFRSYDTQDKLYNNYVARDGKAAADTYSARPGHSEHQSGLAFDVNTINSSFANTKEGKWLAQNAYKYGFILRYPKGKTNETGYIYEPWHFRYVGKELATKLYNDGDWLTLEDYFGITSKYS